VKITAGLLLQPQEPVILPATARVNSNDDEPGNGAKPAEK
jgi:hypothetical protein